MKDFVQKILPWIIVGVLSVFTVRNHFIKDNTDYGYQVLDTVVKYEKVVDKQFDTIYKSYYKPYSVIKHDIDTILKYMEVDTFGILTKFFEERTYSDTLTDDSTYRVIIIDTICWNELKRRSFYHEMLRQKVIVIHKTVYDSDFPIFMIGGMVGRNANEFGLGISGLYSKKGNTFGFDYDFVNKDIYLRYYKTLNLERWKTRRLKSN